jgi:hypothetical protein
MAGQAPRAPAAVFDADPERRQGGHHAGRDRPALRGAPRRLRARRAAFARIPRAEPEQQDPGHHRPGRAGRASAGRCGNRSRSCSTWPRRPASWAWTGGAAPCDQPVAAVPGRQPGADVRPARLLPARRRQGLGRQAPARPLRRRSAAPAERAGRPARRQGLDHGRCLHDRRHRHLPVGECAVQAAERRAAGRHRGFREREACAGWFPGTARGARRG